MLFPSDPVAIQNRKRQLIQESLEESLDEAIGDSNDFVDALADSLLDDITLRTRLNKRVVTKDRVLNILNDLKITDNNSWLKVMGKKNPQGQFVELYKLVQIGGQSPQKVLKAIS